MQADAIFHGDLNSEIDLLQLHHHQFDFHVLYQTYSRERERERETRQIEQEEKQQTTKAVSQSLSWEFKKYVVDEDEIGVYDVEKELKEKH